MAIRGGAKLARFIKRARASARQVEGVKTEIGFIRDPKIARLAATHELGARDAKGRRKLPARPAFGRSLEDLRQAYKRTLRSEARESVGSVTAPMLAAAARAGLEVVRKSYRSGAPGPPVGPGQEARKRGTAGAGKLLVGVEGPKLSEHLTAEVGGSKV